MTSISIAVAVAILTFGSGLLGLYLQKRLPQTHLSGGSKDMILAVIGLLTLLLALVLGTLVGNTYAFFAMQKSELETMASRALLVDQALVEYGPEAKPARNLMKQALIQSYDLFWRGADADPTQLKVEVALDRWEPIANALGALDPKTPAQKDALAAAKANLALMEQTRLLMSLQLSSPVAWSLVTSVILWSMFLFCGFGVLSGTNPTTIVALALGAISVASAMFPDPRSNSALFRSVSRSAIGNSTDARGDRQITPEPDYAEDHRSTATRPSRKQSSRGCLRSARRQEFSNCEIQAAIGMSA